MRTKPKFRLAYKMALLIIALIGVIMGVSFYVTILQDERVKRQEMDKRMTDVANMIAALKLIEPLAGQTVAWPVFHEFVKVVKNLDPNILYISIVANDGSLKAYTLNPVTAANLDKKLTGLAEDEAAVRKLMGYTYVPGKTAKISGDIIVSNQREAIVELRFSLLALNQEITLAKLRTIVLTLLMMILGFFGAVLLAKNITKPIAGLTQAMAKVAKGDLTVNAVAKSSDEIGLLTESFNLMIQDLKEKVRIKDAFDVVADELKEVEKVREAFQVYVSKEAQERFVDAAVLSASEEDHEVALLFADLSQVTQQATTEDAKSFFEALDQYFRKFVATLLEYEGQVYKFSETMFVTVFGIPKSHSDDDRRAILSAVTMQKTLAELNRGRVGRQEKPLYVNLGVCTGRAGGHFLTPKGFQTAQVIKDYLDFTLKMSPQPFSMIMVAGDVFNQVTNLVRGQKVEDLQMPETGETVEVYRITGTKF
jgi:methyl-accepting chemotaxis protein